MQNEEGRKLSWTENLREKEEGKDNGKVSTLFLYKHVSCSRIFLFLDHCIILWERVMLDVARKYKML